MGKKELENYILTPQSIFRLTNRPLEDYPNFEKRLISELEPLKEQTIGGFMDQMSKDNRGDAPSTSYQRARTMVEKRWMKLEDILSVCNGKDLISYINDWLRHQYNCKSSRTQLLKALIPEDVCDEMKHVIDVLLDKQLCNQNL